MAIPKAEGRDEFNAEIDALLPQLKEFGRDYSSQALLLTPSIDRKKLVNAVNKRTVYPEALPALRKLIAERTKAKETVGQ